MLDTPSLRASICLADTATREPCSSSNAWPGSHFVWGVCVELEGAMAWISGLGLRRASTSSIKSSVATFLAAEDTSSIRMTSERTFLWITTSDPTDTNTIATPVNMAVTSTNEKPEAGSEEIRFQTSRLPMMSVSTARGTTARVSLEGIPHCLVPDSSRVFTPSPDCHQKATLHQGVPFSLACSVAWERPTSQSTPAVLKPLSDVDSSLMKTQQVDSWWLTSSPGPKHPEPDRSMTRDEIRGQLPG